MIKNMEQYEGLNITFQTTEDCNLACKYCYEINKQKGKLPFEYAQKFIDMILDTDNICNLKDTKNEWMLESGLIIDFIGGDSLIDPKQIEDILSYYQYAAGIRGHKWAYRWRASISTNGTLFTPQAKDFMDMYKNNLSVGISIDGCPEIHDKNRVFPDGSGSMQAIMKEWGWYYNWCGGNVATKSTLNKDSIPYICKSIKFMHEELKIKYISMNFIFEEMNLTEDDYSRLEAECANAIEYIYMHRNDLYVSMFDKSFGCSHKFTTISDKDTSWCGGGNMPCITPSGKIYPCFRFTKITMEDDIPELILGDVFNGWTHMETADLIAEQTRRKISPPECFECDTEANCAWCIGGAYATTGRFYRPVSLCRIKKIISKYADKYWSHIDESGLSNMGDTQFRSI